ncbi:MAG: adenylate/guanylate cyclase domain-containing protein [Bdellovibrionaceae bacterium]|nr:adenylate/guanylate cyclase domain-containing protein [Bdellovibrionales bacterium]MCB9085272.1 adenylate/guanylate cyclase domain-containing protein [Pseudobdellovibrionaceae bacterium]
MADVKKTFFCIGCLQHMKMPIPLRGPLAWPFRVFGIKPSQMNPNLCTICEVMFTKVKKSKQISIDSTIMFADLRGYTSMFEASESDKIMSLLHDFYDTCSNEVWARGGIINKFIGDCVLAIFNFPIMQERHGRAAVLAALELLRQCVEKTWLDCTSDPNMCIPVCVGVGIHSGKTSIGEVGSSYKDFTAIGPVVNLASRLQSAAKPGEILITPQVYSEVQDIFPNLNPKTISIKGFKDPVEVYSIDQQVIMQAKEAIDRALGPSGGEKSDHASA